VPVVACPLRRSSMIEWRNLKQMSALRSLYCFADGRTRDGLGPAPDAAANAIKIGRPLKPIGGEVGPACIQDETRYQHPISRHRSSRRAHPSTGRALGSSRTVRGFLRVMRRSSGPLDAPSRGSDGRSRELVGRSRGPDRRLRASDGRSRGLNRGSRASDGRSRGLNRGSRASDGRSRALDRRSAAPEGSSRGSEGRSRGLDAWSEGVDEGSDPSLRPSSRLDEASIGWDGSSHPWAAPTTAQCRSCQADRHGNWTRTPLQPTRARGLRRACPSTLPARDYAIAGAL
jgi:hypothetical protein